MAEKNETVTIGKDALYGGAIVVLACLLMISVFTQGFGLVKAAPTACPACNATCPSGTTGTTGTTGNLGNGTTTQPAQPTQPAIGTLTVTDGNLPALGQASAPVTIVQFSDFQCPYCGRLFGGAEAQLRTSYVSSGKVKIYLQELPAQLPPYAMPAALAAMCANDQNKFWDMHDLLFTNQNTWSAATDSARSS